MNMKLKEYIDGMDVSQLVMKAGVLSKLIELESIDRYLGVMLGIELDINVNPIQPTEGRFYGKGIIESMQNKNA